MYGATVKTLQLTFTNHSLKAITNIRIGKLLDGSEVIPFPEIQSLQASETTEAQMSVKFKGVSQPVKFQIKSDQGEHSISLTPAVGELVRGSTFSMQDFTDNEAKLKGAFCSSDSFTLVDLDSQLSSLPQRVTDAAYLSTVSVDHNVGKFRFAGKTMIDDVPLLCTVDVDKATGKGKITIQSENTVLNSMLLKQLKLACLNELSTNLL